MKYRFTKSFNKGDTVDISTWGYTPEPTFKAPDFLEEVKEPVYRYCDTGRVIEKGAAVWIVSPQGWIDQSTWYHKERSELGNAFETEAGAEKHLAFLKARATLKRFMMEKNGNQEDERNNPDVEKYYMFYDREIEILGIVDWTTCQASEIFFNKREDAEECIRLYPNELKIVLGAEDV